MKHEVRYWMTKHPLKIDRYEDIKTAKDIMRQEAIRHLLVFDEGNLIGVLSEADIQLADSVKSRFRGPECKIVKVTVGDLMSRFPITISSESTMADAIRVMSEKHFRSLPVVDPIGKVCGILTDSDILKYALVASQNVNESLDFSHVMSRVHRM